MVSVMLLTRRMILITPITNSFAVTQNCCRNAVETMRANQRLVIDVPLRLRGTGYADQTVGDVIKIQREGVKLRETEKQVLTMRENLRPD